MNGAKDRTGREVWNYATQGSSLRRVHGAFLSLQPLIHPPDDVLQAFNAMLRLTGP
jgi:hypothetical protein